LTKKALTKPPSSRAAVTGSPSAAARRGGRPSRAQAEQLRARILDVATALFFAEGYGATSIEAIAKAAGISKRTFYHRFRDKAELFGAVVHGLIERLRPANDANLFLGGGIDEILRKLAEAILHAALSPEALALQRIIVAEATRFPELAAVLSRQGARRESIQRIGGLLEHAAQTGELALHNPAFAAEQFIQMLVSAPQRRALGLGQLMTPAELEGWAHDSVALFLDGARARPRA
jgi:TetR/AcrR family transcriptional regulator, mexJK operon transcriptional repressor